MQQLSFLPGEMTPGERSLILRALQTLGRHLHEPGVAFTSTHAAREWLILNMAGLEREEFRVLYLNNQNQLIAGETLFTGTINRTEVHPREVIKRALYHNAAAVITRPVKSPPARQTALSLSVWYRHWPWLISGYRTI
jgi:DNA repair protein RadC